MSGQWAGSDRRSTLPANWDNELRPYVLERDGHKCTWRDAGQQCGAPATDVDHIRDRDDHRPQNLRALCGWHHDRKSSAEGNAARAKLRAQLKLPREPHPGLM